MRALLLGAFTLSLGCATAVHQVSTAAGGRPPAGSTVREVSAGEERSVLLGFTRQTDYVDIAWRRLLEQCASAEIQGVTAITRTQLGLLTYRDRLDLEGVCVEDPSPLTP